MDEVNRDVPRAIEIARKIPRSSIAYDSARNQISIWQSWLNQNPYLDNRISPLGTSDQLTEENQSYFDNYNSPSSQPGNQTNLKDKRGKPLVSRPKFTNDQN